MIIRSLCFLLLVVVSQHAHAADVFSPAFKETIERAFQSPTTEGRIALLTDSVRSGTDSEVTRAVGVYFPNDLLGTARKDNACVPQVDALLAEMRTATQVGMAAYFADHSNAYRQRLVAAIECVHTAYADGIPMPADSNTPPG